MEHTKWKTLDGTHWGERTGIGEVGAGNSRRPWSCKLDLDPTTNARPKEPRPGLGQVTLTIWAMARRWEALRVKWAIWGVCRMVDLARMAIPARLTATLLPSMRLVTWVTVGLATLETNALIGAQLNVATAITCLAATVARQI